MNQTSTGGPTQPATSVINTNGGANAVHLDLYKNSSSPATNDGIAGVSYHANNASGTKVEYARIAADQRDITAGSENGSVSVLVAQNSPTPTEFFRFNGSGLSAGTNDLYKPLDVRGNVITTTSGAINIYNDQVATGTIGLTNVAQQGNITITKTGNLGGNVLINSATSTTIQSSVSTTLIGGAGVYVFQSGSTQPKLQTDIANVNYYPTFLVDNNNSNSVSIPPPSIAGQRLTLVNKGITPTSVWSDYGNSIGSGANAVHYATGTGQVWVARSDANVVEIWDSTLSAVQGTITFTTSSTDRAYCFFEEGSWMFIGGSFTAVNGNATPQYGLTRVNLSSFIEDPIYDGPAGINGVNGVVYCITSYGGSLWCGGQFSQFAGAAPTTTCNNLFYVGSYGAGGGSQLYTEAFGGTNGQVNALLSAGSYIFVGGDFTYVNFTFSPINYPYLATWNGGSWDYVGAFTFNAGVNSLNYTGAFPYIIVGGSFSSPYQYICYIDYNFPNNAPVDTTLLVSAPINRGCIYYNGSNYIHTTTNGVYFSSTFQVFTSLGTPYLATPSFIGYWGGEPKVAWSNYSYIQSKSNVSQNASFVLTSGSFKFNGTSYTTATISLVDVGWDFVGDITGSGIWRQASYNAWGSFS